MATLNWPYDAQYVLEDGAGAITATAAGSDTHDVGDAALKPGAVAIVDITALDTTDTDETYVVEIQGSNDSFTTPVELASRTMTATGRYVIPIYNWQAGTTYREIRVYFTIGGTTPSITCVVWCSGF